MLKKALFLILSLLPFISLGQNNLIPNTLNCSSVRPKFEFDIQPVWSAGTSINNESTPLVGDIDGDGKTEILVLTGYGTVSNGSLIVFDGKTGAERGSITGLNYYPTPITMCDVDNDKKTEILFYDNATLKATLYEITSVSPLTFGVRWSTSIPSTGTFSIMPFSADLDGDGKVEFIVGRHILDRFGNIKATIPLGALGLFDVCYSYAIDLDGDGKPEVIAGTDVYKFDGTNLTFWRRCPSYASAQEGTNMAVDINLDGVVDLVYHANHASSSGDLYNDGKIVVWTPSTNTVVGTINNVTGTKGHSYTVVGDIDGVVTNGKKYPEICYNTYNKLYAYTYDGTNFSQKWVLPTNEGSGLATFTFFDFNLDGVAELVYRDETTLHIYDASESAVPEEKYSQPATSGTCVETPVVADVTGDGSADIIVTGSGKVHVFEGKISKWASAPNVWNQQLYSPLLINRDLTIISNVASPAWNKKDCKNEYPRFYNGGPMQVPLISEETYCPVDIAPDVYVVEGKITIINANTVEIEVTFGNKGMVTASGSMPIRFYQNSIASSNILSSANTTLGADLAIGQTRTITKTITGLISMPTQFYVRVLDDGTNFPALGAFSDCNLSNNTKSFGTLELIKTVDYMNSCVNGVSTFTVKLTNNTDETGTPITYNNIVLVDSLGTGWQHLTTTPINGTITSAYNNTTHKLEWTIPSLAPGDSAKLMMTAKAIAAGDIRNTVWVTIVDTKHVGQESIQAYVIVTNQQAPQPPTISGLTNLCPPTTSVLLTATAPATEVGISWQWLRNGIEITGATSSTYSATTTGDYTVKYFNGVCVSQLSTATTITSNCLTPLNPDNIIDPLCSGTPPASTWGIAKLYSSKQAVYDADVPLVGDVDGDGEIEIICANYKSDYSSDSIIIFNGKTGVVKKKYKTTLFNPAIGSRAIAKIDGISYMFIAEFGTSNGMVYLYRYNLADGTSVRFNYPYYNGICTNSTPSIFITDFNADGIPEVMVRDQIYNAKTGDLLLDASTLATKIDNFGMGAGHPTDFATVCGSWAYPSFSVAADMDNDGIPEYVAGNKIYKINITSTTGTAGNTLSILREGPSPITLPDGFTAVADINLDGYLDVVVTRNIGVNKYMYAWDGLTGALLGNLITINESFSGYGPSIPFIGDLDGDGTPEIAFSTHYKLHAYKYNKVTNKFGKLAGWINTYVTTTDPSSSTTLTLFDFNQDGKVELVYRDETDLRIINGTTGENIPGSTFPCFSNTLNEYPVVADVTGDGYANIVVLGKNATASGNKGYLHVYTNSAVGAWAPARPVWNQWAYNAVNVNSDLTIPKVYFNPATKFPGVNGVLGDADDVRPYNAFLQQQTSLSIIGLPIFPLPNITWNVSPTFTYHPNGDSLSVTINVKNIGDAGIGAPVYFTVYKSATISAANKLGTGAYNGYINEGASLQFTFTIKNFKANIGTEATVTIRLNDNGTTFPYQQECVTTDDVKTQVVFAAADDYIQVIQNTTGKIDVLENDILGGIARTAINGSVTNGNHGTATWNNVTKDVTYTPAIGFLGVDTITYTITSGGFTSTAIVIITVVEMPDNIDEANCTITPPKGTWSIKESYRSKEKVFSMATPLVGDIDSDGFIEIVIPGAIYKGSSFYSDSLKIFDATNKLLKNKFPVEKFHAGFGTIAIADVDKDGIAEIFVATCEKASAGNQGYILCYTPSGVLKWKSDNIYTTDVAKRGYPFLSIADINNDGIPEILANDRIFNAQNGKLLLDCNLVANGLDYGTGAGHESYYIDNGTVNYKVTYQGAFATLADMDKNGTLELVAGRNIYKLNINSTNPALNSCTILRSAQPRSDVGDGFTVVADINLDGYLDVVVTRKVSDSQAGFYVWNGLTGELMNKVPINIASSSSYGGSISIPFVGDLNNDKYPEIAFSTNAKLSAYRYNSLTQDIVSFWALTTSDVSSATTLTLFDFNQDGKMELVYRDQDNLRIINGSESPAQNRTTTPCKSFTMSEYPVVADVANSGHASIIVVGQVTNSWTNGVKADCDGFLYIFDNNPLTGDPWAPARKVWNQWAYNAINVNENLTIPRYQLAPTTIFPGADEILGTADDTRPYNAFLQQQTKLNKYGTSLFLAPDAVIMGTPAKQYYGAGDSLVVTVSIKNQGNAALQAPVYITAYKDAVAATNVMTTYQYPLAINVNETKTAVFKIPNISNFTPFNKIIVKINDKGNTRTYQKECDSITNQTFEFTMGVMANNDIAITTTNVPRVIDVLANDLLSNCTRSNINIAQTTIAAYQAKHAASISFNANKDLVYTPVANWVGIDSLRYVVTDCNNVKDSATVYIATLKPSALSYVACPNASVTLEVQTITGVQYYWYTTQTGGTAVIGGSNINRLAVTKNASAQQTWWVEARYGTTVFPRYRIDLNLSASCGGIPIISCVTEGTLLFKEDFGGNDPTAPRVSTTGLPAGVTNLTFSTSNIVGSSWPNNYWLLKENINNKGNNGVNGITAWHKNFSDHTYPNDLTRGNMLMIDASTTASKFYEYKITGLCGEVKNLYFSTWIANLMLAGVSAYPDDPNLLFELTDDSNNVLASYTTGLIPRDAINNIQWRNYGFGFELPQGQTSLTLRIYNNNLKSQGNDFVMDDIEVHLCAPAVPALVNGKATDRICNGTITLTANYTDNSTFVTTPTDKLAGYWLQSSTGNVNNPAEWSKIAGSDVAGTIGSTSITIPPFMATPISGSTVYYRFVISNSANINNPNCRAASAVLPVTFYSHPASYPNIRVQTCIAPDRQINLSSYLDTLDFISATWATVNAPSVTAAGKLQTGALTAPNTYVYKYTITNHCETVTSNLYLKTIKPGSVVNTPQQVVVCYENAANLQLNQILGIDADGTWAIATDVAPYVHTAVVPAIYAGAKIFDGKGLYEALQAASSNQFKITYNGDTNAREIIFKYKVTDISSCLYNEEYTLKVILTSKLP